MSGRDLSAKEFAAKLRANGFTLMLGWITDVRHPENPRAMGCIYQMKPFRMKRRESLAAALRARREFLKKKEA